MTVYFQKNIHNIMFAFPKKAKTDLINLVDRKRNSHPIFLNNKQNSNYSAKIL